MKDVNLTVRKAYLSALNNTIQSNGVNVPFYDQVPSGANFPYIYVSGNTCSEDGTKDYWGFNYTITIVVTSQEQGNSGGQLVIDKICDSILHKIRGSFTTDQPLSFGPDFANVVTILDKSNYLNASEVDSIIRSRILTFRHKIQQLNNN